MTIDISKQEALVLLTEAVKNKGAEYVYRVPATGTNSGDCIYTDRDGNPACIIGHALAYAGVPIEVLHAIDWGGAVVLADYDEERGVYLDEPIEIPVEDSIGDTGISEPDVLYWLSKNGVNISEPAIGLFAAVQRAQDNRTPWGEAVTKAISTTTNGRI